MTFAAAVHAMHHAYQEVTGIRGTDVARWSDGEFVERTLASGCAASSSSTAGSTAPR